jgi:hypothetical protein
LPEDISEYVKEKYESVIQYGEAIHDFSWLNKEEFEICIKTYSDSLIDIIEYKVILSSMVVFGENKIETRIVFWFEL